MDEEARKLQARAQSLSEEQQAEVEDILRSARIVSRQMVTQAREQSDEIMQTARDRAAQILAGAEEQAAEIRARAEAAQPSGMSAEMQEYVVRTVGACFSSLRQQQLDAAEAINAQWQAFLSGLSLAEPAPPAEDAALSENGGVSRQDIENRVSAIAQELMEIIGK